MPLPSGSVVLHRLLSFAYAVRKTLSTNTKSLEPSHNESLSRSASLCGGVTLCRSRKRRAEWVFENGFITYFPNYFISGL